MSAALDFSKDNDLLRSKRAAGNPNKIHAVVGVAVLASCVTLPMYASAVSSVDLSNYTLSARYQLPEPTRTVAPLGSVLAQEVSAVTWNRDTNTLFMVGDGGTSIVQTDLQGNLINSMTLAAGTSPQGTAFYDPEGLTYVGNGKFVMTEERYRIVNQFTYTPGTTLNYSDAQHVKLGTTVGNIGLEGIAYDPLTSGATPGFVVAKEKQPIGVFQTNVDFVNGTATNGSVTTVNSTNLFDPTLTGLLDIADIYAMSNLAGIGAGDQSHLLLLSQESGKVIEVDRNGTTFSSLTIPFLPNNPLGSTALSGVGGPTSVVDQQHEGITMDDIGNIYIVSENGGGDINNPQLWVYTAPVPEPGEYAMLLAGLAVIGSVVRRRIK